MLETRTLIYDDHAIARTGMRLTFDQLEDFEQVGEAENAIVPSCIEPSSMNQYLFDLLLAEKLMPDLKRVVDETLQREKCHQAELALRKSEERFRVLIENSSDAISLLSSEGKILYNSPSIERVSGYTDKELIGTNPLLYVHPADQAYIVSLVMEVIERPEKIITAQYRLRHKNGHWLWIETSVQNMLANQAVEAIVFNYRDITERMRTEEEIRSRMAHLNALNTLIANAANTHSSLKKLLEISLHHMLGTNGLRMGVIWTAAGEFHSHGLSNDFSRLVSEAVREHGVVVERTQATANWQRIRMTDPRAAIAKLYTAHGIRADIVTPLWRGDRVVGGLIIMSSHPRQWAEDEITLVESIGRQLGIVVEHAKLEDEKRKRLVELETVNRVSQSMRTAQSLDDLLQRFFDVILEVLETNAGSIWLYDAGNNQLNLHHSRGWISHLQPTALLPGEGIVGAVFSSGEPQVVNEFAVSPLGHPIMRADSPPGWGGACVQIRMSQEILGILVVAVHLPRILTTEEVHMLEILAELAGNAIHRIRLLTRLQQSNRELSQAYDATIEGWSRALDLRDKETEGHALRVTEMTVSLAAIMGFEESALVNIRRGALLHDIGKMGIPDRILRKPSSLDTDDREVMQLHPKYAYDLLSQIPFLQPALAIPFCHHEKWDGTGYPRGIKGEEIPIEARIFAVVDVWDALSSDRPYRKAWSQQQVLEYIREQAGKQFDPAVVDQFIEHYLKHAFDPRYDK